MVICFVPVIRLQFYIQAGVDTVANALQEPKRFLLVLARIILKKVARSFYTIGTLAL